MRARLNISTVNEPRDAAEYFEKILHLASPAASKVSRELILLPEIKGAVKIIFNEPCCFQIFHGVLTHRTICGSCQTHTETDLSFWHLPLALVGSNEDDYSVVRTYLQIHYRNIG